MNGTRIVVTYNCNIMCSNCLYRCGPHRKGIMSVEDFEKSVFEAYNSSSLDYISIEGGEPFLHSGIIYKYLKSINSIGIYKNIITNGYWGNIEPFMEILIDFKKIGVSGIILEYDYFHSYFIGVETIENAIEKSVKAGFDITLRSLFITNNMADKRDVETFKYIKKIKKKYNNINLLFEVKNNINNSLLNPANEMIILYKQNLLE